MLNRWLAKVGPKLALSDFGNDHSLLVAACRTLMNQAPAATAGPKPNASSGPKAIDQLKAVKQCGDDPACNAALLNNATAGGDGAAVPASAGANLNPELKAACVAALAQPSNGGQTADTRRGGGSLGDIQGSVPGLDEDPAAAAQKPSALSQWVAKNKGDIRTGLVGGFIGMMFGSFFGPVGIAVGIALGAAGLIGLYKLKP